VTPSFTHFAHAGALKPNSKTMAIVIPVFIATLLHSAGSSTFASPPRMVTNGRGEHACAIIIVRVRRYGNDA
jgi:hypothetical protein